MGFSVWVGIDWATEAHQICIVDEKGDTLQQLSIPHDAEGFDALVAVLNEHAAARDLVAIAIEVPRGNLVDFLVDRGYAVFAINPKQLDRFRDRHSTAGAKDDSRDAFVLADSLRTDQRCFKHVSLDDPVIIRCRELTRFEDNLKAAIVRTSNRLREQLYRFYPNILKLCPAADEPWFWSLVEKAPTPVLGAALRPGHIKGILTKHRIRRLEVESIRATLKVRPVFVAPGVVEAATVSVMMLLSQLQLLHQQRKECEKHLKAILDDIEADAQKREHRDVQVLLSMPGIGRFVAATMLAEASMPLAERDYQSLRVQGGCAPVTRRSGKSHGVRMRHACNPRLRNAFYHWARTSSQHDPLTRVKYNQLRSKGHGHGRALRSIADGLLRVLVAMLKAGVVYDPQRRTLKAAA